MKCDRGYQLGLTSTLVLMGCLVGANASAQITPDETLGGERSIVQPGVQVRGDVGDRIEGGARRGANLFHSFEDFNVNDGQRIYFGNPDGIVNILSRVTGRSPSNILGTLGVDGAANLFFLNPNGILFGPNARLDVSGSFVGTTADAIGFGEVGFFSARNPEVPSALLTVNPSALFFNQIGNRAIVSQARGLVAAPGQSLLFVGGDMVLDGSALFSSGGQVEVGGVAGTGTVSVISSGNALQLEFPTEVFRANVVLNNSFIGTTSGGSITINAQNLGLYGSSIFSTLLAEQSGHSGEIVIDATGGLVLDRSNIGQIGFRNSLGDTGNLLINAQSVRLSNQSIISNISQRNAGDTRLNVADAVTLDGSEINSANWPSSTGRGSNVFVTAQSINLTNRGSISSVSTGQGAAGGMNLTAQDAITLSGTSIIQSSVNPSISGTTSRAPSGDIDLQARSLSLNEGSQIASRSFDAGRSGDIHINTREAVTLNNSSIGSGAVGNTEAGGNIQLQTGQLSLLNGGMISADTRSSPETGNLGQGNAGNITITAQYVSLINAGRISADSSESRGNAGDITIRANDIEITGFLRAEELNIPDADLIPGSLLQSAISSRVNTNDINDIEVQGGSITIETNRLRLNNGGNITTNIQRARGQAGNVSIQANEQISLDNAIISSSVAAGATGNSGRVSITTPALFLQRRSNITTSTGGNGDAGNLTIEAEQINLQNASIDTAVGTGGRGNAGDLTISTQRLQLRNASYITSLSQGIGNAGNLTIRAEQIGLRGSGTSIATQINPGGRGRGGNLDIRTGQLRVLDNAQISTGTFGIGNAGNLRIRARTIELMDTPDPVDDFTGLFTLINRGGVGDAGSLTVLTDRLTIRNGGAISSEVFGQGQGGNIRIRASDRINIIGVVPVTTGDVYRSGIFTGTSGQGDAGNISIYSGNGIILQQRGRISSASLAGSRGDAGDINLQTGTVTILDGSTILASVGSARRDAQGVALSGGQGRGGDIQITATDAVRISGSDRNGLSSTISTSTGRGAAGRAGEITLTTDALQINNGGIVVARTLNNSPAGGITVNANTFAATNGGQIVTSTSGAGNAGRIRLNVADEIHLSGTDSNFADRLDRANRYIDRLDQGDRINDFIANQGANSGLFASTRSNSTGEGGRITVNSTNVTLQDGAQISAQSQGRGIAGDISLNVSDQLQLTNSDIATTATRSSGGNIEVNENSDSGIIILRGDSDITTNSQGNGGNITLQGSGIVAFDDSDILAQSQDARGGNITLAPFFGTINSDSNPPFDGNGQVDVNADGQIAAGTITTPDTTVIQNSLTDLPESAIDPQTLLATSCVVRSQEQQGRFVIVGAGGLPQRPGDLPLPDHATGAVRSVPTNADDDAPAWQRGDPIVEPQNAYQLEDGRVILSRECSNP